MNRTAGRRTKSAGVGPSANGGTSPHAAARSSPPTSTSTSPGRASSKPLTDALVVDVLRRDLTPADEAAAAARSAKRHVAETSSAAGTSATTTAAAMTTPCGPSFLDRVLGGSSSSSSGAHGSGTPTLVSSTGVAATAAAGGSSGTPTHHGHVSNVINNNNNNNTASTSAETGTKPLYRPPHARKTSEAPSAAAADVTAEATPEQGVLARRDSASASASVATPAYAAADVHDAGAAQTVESSSPAVHPTPAAAVKAVPGGAVSMAAHVKAMHPRHASLEAVEGSVSESVTTASEVVESSPVSSYSDAARRGVSVSPSLSASSTVKITIGRNGTTSPTNVVPEMLIPAAGLSAGTTSSATMSGPEMTSSHEKNGHSDVSGVKPTDATHAAEHTETVSTGASVPEATAPSAQNTGAEAAATVAAAPLSKKARAKRNKKEKAAAAAAAAAAADHVLVDMDGTGSADAGWHGGIAERLHSAPAAAWPSPSMMYTHHHHHHHHNHHQLPRQPTQQSPLGFVLGAGQPPARVGAHLPMVAMADVQSPLAGGVRTGSAGAGHEWSLASPTSAQPDRVVPNADIAPATPADEAQTPALGSAGPSTRRGGGTTRSQSQRGRGGGGTGSIVPASPTSPMGGVSATIGASGEPSHLPHHIHHPHQHQQLYYQPQYQSQQPERSSFRLPATGSASSTGAGAGGGAYTGNGIDANAGHATGSATGTGFSLPVTSASATADGHFHALNSHGGGGGSYSDRVGAQQQQQQAWAVGMMPQLDLIATLPVFIEACLTLTSEEKLMRESFFDNIRAITRASFNAKCSVEVRVHGSVTTGLALSSSDIDLLVVQYQPTLPLEALYTVASALLQVDAVTLTEAKERLALIDEEAVDVVGLRRIQEAAAAATAGTHAALEKDDTVAEAAASSSPPTCSESGQRANAIAGEATTALQQPKLSPRQDRVAFSRSHTALLWPTSMADETGAGAGASPATGGLANRGQESVAVAVTNTEDDEAVMAAIAMAEKAEADAISSGCDAGRWSQGSGANGGNSVHVASADPPTQTQKSAAGQGEVHNKSTSSMSNSLYSPGSTGDATALLGTATKPTRTQGKVLHHLTGGADSGADVNEIYRDTEDLVQAETVYRVQIEHDYTFSTKSAAVTAASVLEAVGVPSASPTASPIALSVEPLNSPLGGLPTSLRPPTEETADMVPPGPHVPAEGDVAEPSDDHDARRDERTEAETTDTTTPSVSAATGAQEPLFRRRPGPPQSAESASDARAPDRAAAYAPSGQSTFRPSYVAVEEGPLYYVQTIISTRVPVIKVTEKATGMKADITFAGGEHWRSMQLTRQLVTRFPQARQLILFLKYLVCRTGIGENEPGGVTSFVIYLMVRHFFNECVKRVVEMLRQREDAMKAFFAVHIPAHDGLVLHASDEEPERHKAAIGGESQQDKKSRPSAGEIDAEAEAERHDDASIRSPAKVGSTSASHSPAAAAEATTSHALRSSVPTMAVLEHLLNAYFHAVDDGRRAAAASWMNNKTTTKYNATLQPAPSATAPATPAVENAVDAQAAGDSTSSATTTEDPWRQVRDVVLSFLEPPPLPHEQIAQPLVPSTPPVPRQASMVVRSAPSPSLECAVADAASHQSPAPARVSEEKSTGTEAHALPQPQPHDARDGILRAAEVRAPDPPATTNATTSAMDRPHDSAAKTSQHPSADLGTRGESVDEAALHDAALEEWAIDYLSSERTSVSPLFYDFCHYFGCAFNYETTGIHFDADGNSTVVVKPYMCARRGQHFHMTSPFDPEYDLTARMTSMRAFQELCWWFATYATPPPMASSAPHTGGCTLQYLLQWLNPMGAAHDLYRVHERLIAQYQEHQQQQQQQQQYDRSRPANEASGPLSTPSTQQPSLPQARGEQGRPAPTATCDRNGGAVPAGPPPQQRVRPPPRSMSSGLSSTRSRSVGSELDPARASAAHITRFPKQRADSPSTAAAAAAAATASMTSLSLPVARHPSAHGPSSPPRSTAQEHKADDNNRLLAKAEADVAPIMGTAVAAGGRGTARASGDASGAWPSTHHSQPPQPTAPYMNDSTVQMASPTSGPGGGGGGGGGEGMEVGDAASAAAMYYQQPHAHVRQAHMYVAGNPYATAGMPMMMMNPADPNTMMTPGVMGLMPVLSQDMQQFLYYYQLQQQQQQQQYYSQMGQTMGVYMYPTPMMVMPPAHHTHQTPSQQQQQQQQPTSPHKSLQPFHVPAPHVTAHARASRLPAAGTVPGGAQPSHPPQPRAGSAAVAQSTPSPSAAANLSPPSDALPQGRRPHNPAKAPETVRKQIATSTPVMSRKGGTQADVEVLVSGDDPEEGPLVMRSRSPQKNNSSSVLSTPVAPSVRQGQTDWAGSRHTQQPTIELTAAAIRAMVPSPTFDDGEMTDDLDDAYECDEC